MDLPENKAGEIIESLRGGYAAIIIDEKLGEPIAVITPDGDVVPSKKAEKFSTHPVSNINGITNINILCKDGSSPCCVEWDDKRVCWC